MKKITTIICTCLLSLSMNAQDFHLSQFEEAPLYLNPALIGQGLREGMDYRVSNLYRSQWGSISTKPFSTSYLSYDTRFKNRWGLGINLINNQAGAPTFRTFNLMLSGSYDIINDPLGEHVLTTGMQMGLMNKNFKAESLVFDQQYSSTTGEFDPSINNGENLASTNTYRFDAGWGIYYRYRPSSEKYSPYIGFSLGHISFPNQRFLGEKEAMPIIWKVNIGSDVEINEKIEIRPSFLMMYQKKAQEYYLNVNGKYQLSNEDYDLRLLLGYRLKDAFVIGVGMRYKDFVGMISYDFNTSYLSNYTNGKGGFEFGISYQGFYKNEKIKSIMKYNASFD